MSRAYKGLSKNGRLLAIELTHIWLLVEDMPRALRFYRDTLGLTVAADLGGFVELNANEHFLLSLFERGGMQESEPGIPISPVGG
jgi:catechol 2,3-dioxygenase-like lactoylglutathione lyase family enzyme